MVRDLWCFSGFTTSMTIVRSKQERRKKMSGAWLGTVVLMFKRKKTATKWMEMTFHESFLAQSSQVRIIWPRINSLASSIERNSSGGSAMDVKSEVKQAISRSEAFIL